MVPLRTPFYRCPLLLLSLLALALLACPAGAQGIDPEDRPVVEVRVEGLNRVNAQLVRNQLRQKAGEPYDAATVEQDIVRITYLGRFSRVTAEVAEAADQAGVILTYRVVEHPLLRGVTIAGAKAVDEIKVRDLLVLRTGDPVDPFLLERGKKQIVAEYQDKGYFTAHVRVDEDKLRDEQLLDVTIVEGPRVKVRAVEFEGNQTFESSVLKTRVRSKTFFPIFQKGALDRTLLDQDAASIRLWYQDRGYLDAQADRRIEVSPDGQSAVVIFVIEEGRLYTVADVRVTGNVIFSTEQIKAVMPLNPGDVYSGVALDESLQAIRDMYGKLGFIDAVITIDRLFDPKEPRVDLSVTIEEGTPSMVGKVTVTGNEVTRGKVILRQVRGMDPGRPFDRTGVTQTERRLQNSPLFGEANVTILGRPGDEARDVLIEVLEQNTGSISLGAGISSDSGVIGAIDVLQRNFDIADPPENLGELFTGQAFRGAGQTFQLTLQPGNQTSTYSVGWREPYLLESDYFTGASFRYFTRDRSTYDEERVGAFFDIGQRFGDVWSASIAVRGDQIDIAQIEPDAPVDVFEVEGDSLLTGLGFSLTRSTVDSRISPSRGSRLTFSVEQVGALGGDYDFTKLGARFDKFYTLDQDFLGRKTIFSFRAELAYIPQEDRAPIFERYFAGGHRSFRGFAFRGVGPRGVRADTGLVDDDAVGGDFMALMGLQYEFPILEDNIRGVIFTDQGTVQEDVGLDEWRVSIGTGIRLKLPIFGAAPLAIDLAIPLIKESTDDDQIISFDLSLPMR